MLISFFCRSINTVNPISNCLNLFLTLILKHLYIANGILSMFSASPDLLDWDNFNIFWTYRKPTCILKTYSRVSQTLLFSYFSLTCLINHQNLLHLNMSQIVTLAIDSFVFETISYVNKTSIMFNYFTRYPRSMNAVVSYTSNEIILNTYKFINNFYLETKKFFLSKIIQYSYESDFLVKISPFLSDSITYFSSNDIRTIIHLFNNRLRQLLSLWMKSPIEYKIIRTTVSQLIETIDKFRSYLDDKLDFLLPTLQIYTPRSWTNGSSNKTFLFTWSKQYNLSKIIDGE